MKRSRLAEHIETLRALLADLETEAKRKGLDEFAVYVYRCRQRCREVERTDVKSGKRGERYAWESYTGALRFGYRGSLHEWMKVLWAHPTRDGH